MTPRGVPHEREAARARRHDELLDAAVELVRREGPYVSMDQIAAECGITKPIIYRHFGDRDGLVQEVADRFVEALVERLAPLLERDADPLDLLTTTIDSYLELIEHDTNLYRFVTVNTGGDQRDVFAGLVAEQVALVLEQVLTERGLPTDAARPWAYGIVGLVHFAGDWWVGAEGTRRPRRRLVDQLVTLVWQGAEGIGLGDQPPDPPLRVPRRRRRT